MPRRLCFYSRRTNAELEAMYKARTGKDMPRTKKRMTKRDMSNQLRKVDRRPWNYGTKFRFQDLEGEMRNLIYRELLPVRPRSFEELFARPREKCQPAILRACKQTYSEAKGILYGDHEGEIMIRSTTYPPQTRIGVDRETTVHDSLRHSRRGDKLTDSRPNWPSYLLNFAKIDVRVRMVAAASTRNSPHVTLDALFVTNQELLGLVSFLSHSTALETVRINLLNPTALPQDSDLVSMLRPLARLAPNINIDIVNVPSDIKDQVLHEKESYNGTEHLYDDFRKTHTNLKELEDFQQAHFETKDRFTEIEQQRLAMERPLEVSGFVNDHVEKQLIEATTKAKYFLASGIIDKVNRQARQKAKEVKQQAAKKIDELEGLRQKFVEIEKAAQKTSTTTTT